MSSVAVDPNATYFSNMFPSVYTREHQAGFTKQGDIAIRVALEVLNGVQNLEVEEKKDLKGLSLKERYQQAFFEILDLFANVRHKMALDFGDPDARHFGRRRLHTDYDNCTTPLSPKYTEFNKRMAEFFIQFMKKHLPIPIRGPMVKKSHTVQGEHLGRKFSFTVEVMDAEDLRARKLDQEMHPDIHKFKQSKAGKEWPKGSIDLDVFPPSKKDLLYTAKFHECQKAFKRDFPEAYAHKELRYAMEEMVTEFPSPKIIRRPGQEPRVLGNTYNFKSHWILGTLRIQIGSEMVELSKYFTWAYQTYNEDPVKRIRKGSVVWLIHQDVYAGEPTLNEIASIFADALMVDMTQKTGYRDLARKIATCRYLFAHNMPWVRGSAWGGERFEKLTYLFHQIRCTHLPKTMGDLEAFVAPTYRYFMKSLYKTTVEIAKIKPKADPASSTKKAADKPLLTKELVSLASEKAKMPLG